VSVLPFRGHCVERRKAPAAVIGAQLDLGQPVGRIFRQAASAQRLTTRAAGGVTVISVRALAAHLWRLRSPPLQNDWLLAVALKVRERFEPEAAGMAAGLAP